MKLHAHIGGALHLQKAGGPFPVVINFRIGRIMANNNLMFLRKLHHFFEKFLTRHHRGGIVGGVEKHHFGFLGYIFWNSLQIWQKSIFFPQWHHIGGPAGKTGRHWIHGIPRTGNQNNIARIDERHRNVANAFFGSNQRHDFGFGIKAYSKPTLIPVGYRRSEGQHTVIRGILMMLRIPGSLPECVDNGIGGRQIGITDTQINNIHASFDGFTFHVINSGKQIRW